VAAATGHKLPIGTEGTRPRPRTTCLSMIAKNEAPVIVRCLRFVRSLIGFWIIVDSGSSDGTQDAIREHMADVAGALYERLSVDFEHNRTEAVIPIWSRCCRGVCKGRCTNSRAVRSREAGDPERCRRAKLGFYRQEVFISLLRAGQLMLDFGFPDHEVLATYREANRVAKDRAEALLEHVHPD